MNTDFFAAGLGFSPAPMRLVGFRLAVVVLGEP